MKDKKLALTVTIVLLLMPLLSGCLDSFLDGPTIYQDHPTKISYDISYGYSLNATGTGKYVINYDCDIPAEPLAGSRDYDILYTKDYKIINLVNNSFVSWNITGNGETTYELGLTVSVDAESFYVSDLNGENALTIQEINNSYADIAKKYLNEQSNETTTLIEPDNPTIKMIANNILGQSDTNNSFTLAKSLFIWLKQNTRYQIHEGEGDVQPAVVTCQKKTGDCDDLSFLYISLCRAIGIPARLIRGYLLTDEGYEEVTAIAHAWVEVFVGVAIGNGGWIPVECSSTSSDMEIQVNQNFGIESAQHLRLFVDDGSNESIITSLSGISYVKYGIDRDIEIQAFTEIENYLEISSKKLVVTKENIRSYQ